MTVVLDEEGDSAPARRDGNLIPIKVACLACNGLARKACQPFDKIMASAAHLPIARSGQLSAGNDGFRVSRAQRKSHHANAFD
jgi:hypothetical protein